MSASPPTRPSFLLIEPIELPATPDQLIHALNELAVHGSADMRVIQDMRYILQLAVGLMTPAIGMAYGYFSNMPIPGDGTFHQINFKVGEGGAYGNAQLFQNVPHGIQLKQAAIISVTLWAQNDLSDNNETRLLAIQLDKQQGANDPAKLLLRVPSAFVWSMSTAAYNGVLLAGDIIRALAMCTPGAMNITDGYATVLAVPIAV